ncbi:MAG: hypothetical protein JXB48_03245 [Candidatus Latescibacteria bacterium]|nr:hypothetical protein [Candidatus Latescibacterota bacterium]
MNRFLYAFCSLYVFAFFQAYTLSADTVTTTWSGNAETIYDTGFMHMLMKYPRGGVCLFNMELIENDAPGSGYSEKGVDSDVVWGQNYARKILNLTDPRAEKAWFVAVFEREVWFLPASEKSKKKPLTVSINGNSMQYDDWGIDKSIITYRWFEFPANWLKKGSNVIELSCPDASSPEEGWEVWLARADEFEDGGGDPTHVGETSFKSTDGGKSWKESPFGPDKNERAEYTIRLSLDRYVKTGWLESPVIDLWKGDSQDFIVPLREIQTMKLAINSDVPEETDIKYYFRKSTNPQPFSDDWEEYEFIGNGSSLDFNIGGANLNRRYVQFKAVLSTQNPLKTPVIKSARISAELFERVPLYKNIYVVEVDNPQIRYSSLGWEWEKWDRPEYKTLRERENLDEVIAESRTQFDAQVKLMDYVARRWLHSGAFPEYPLWDALSILDRIETAGAGGYCLMFNTLLCGMCQAYGWNARLTHVSFHEICEVWNDELGKWIFLDADGINNYNYDLKTAVPLNIYELHNLYLDYYFPGRTIDWMNDWIGWMDKHKDKEFPVGRGSLTHHEPGFHYSSYDYLSGFINAGFIRVVPRNNWFEKPYPKPLTHNSFTPWDGYVNWYDKQSPPQRHYSQHTDRPQDIWPDLNLVHVDAIQGFGNDRLFLRFETYTPNFGHFEINPDDTGWKQVEDRWIWLLQSGRNNLRVRAVNKLGAKGKPSVIKLNFADAPFGE